jgi:hypothetical protein
MYGRTQLTRRRLVIPVRKNGNDYALIRGVLLVAQHHFVEKISNFTDCPAAGR